MITTIAIRNRDVCPFFTKSGVCEENAKKLI